MVDRQRLRGLWTGPTSPSAKPISAAGANGLHSCITKRTRSGQGGTLGVGAADPAALAGERKHQRRHRLRHQLELEHARRVAEVLDGVESLPFMLDQEQPVGVLCRFRSGQTRRPASGLRPYLASISGVTVKASVADSPGSSVAWPRESLQKAWDSLLAHHVLVVEVHGLGAGQAAGVGHPHAGAD